MKVSKVCYAIITADKKEILDHNRMNLVTIKKFKENIESYPKCLFSYVRLTQKGCTDSFKWLKYYSNVYERRITKKCKKILNKNLKIISVTINIDIEEITL